MKTQKKEKHRYIFPNILAKMMKNVPMQVQLESSMMATALILVGMALMAFFLIFFTQQTIAFKILTMINLIGAFIFMMSNLVTTYQQYISYMDVMDMQKSMMAANAEDPMNPFRDLKDLEKANGKKYNRLHQLLFFGGLALLIFAICARIWLFNNLSVTIQNVICGILIIVSIIMMITPSLRARQANKKEAGGIANKPVQKQVARTLVKQPIKPPVNNNADATQRPIPIARSPPQQMPLIRKRPEGRNIPIQKPQQARPIIRPQQMPQRNQQQFIPRRQIIPRQQIISRPQPGIPQKKLGLFAKRKEQKTNKMISDIEKVLNGQIYEINRLKSQERRS